MINEATKLVGLIGWPIQYSISPDMHNAAFNALNLDWQYFLFPIRPNKFETEISTFLTRNVQGYNVTIPYKEAILSHLGTIDQSAGRLGAVNTITIQNTNTSGNNTCGYNTDVLGFINALRESGFKEIVGKNAVVIGAGGAARAVVFGLINEGISKITILNRSIQNARHLQRDFKEFTSRLKIFPLTPKNLIDSAFDAALLVNATPIGSLPEPDKSIWPDDVPLPSDIAIFDLVYNPSMTKLLRQGEASRATIISGIEMLVQQGALSFQIWTKIQAPVEVMRQACYKKIGGRNV